MNPMQNLLNLALGNKTPPPAAPKEEAPSYVLNSEHHTCFTQRGNAFFPGAESDVAVVHPKLPPGTYVVNASMMGFFLEKTVDFARNTKIYGKVHPQSDRILASYRSKAGNLGVILTGEKGSGKSLLAREVCIKGLQSGLPVLLITTEFAGKAFSEFLDMISQECIVFIDEYEKIYSRESQEKMLSLLDGVYQSKKLFVLTCNDISKVDVNLQNRPGRVHYLLEFSGLDLSFIKEYVEDNLRDKTKVAEVLNVCTMFYRMTFDMLQALVWEVNQYNEKPVEALRMLNCKPTSMSRENFNININCAALGTVINNDVSENDDVLIRDPFQRNFRFTFIVKRSIIKADDAALADYLAKQEAVWDRKNVESAMYANDYYTDSAVINHPSEDGRPTAENKDPKLVALYFEFSVSTNKVVDAVGRIYNRNDGLGNIATIAPIEKDDDSFEGRYNSAF